MQVRSPILFRVVAVAIALAFGLSAAGQTFAQGSTPGMPAGLQGGAQATYTNQSNYSSLIFTVFRFKDTQAATDGTGTITNLVEQQLSSSLSGAGMGASTSTSEATAQPSDTTGGTGAEATATAKPIEIQNAKGLDGVGDEAHAYQLDVAQGVEIYYLLIRDGKDVHFWAYVSVDLGAGGSAATAEATAGPNGSPLDVLTGIASDWFSGGSHDSDAPADALPTQDKLPQGFSLTDHQDNLLGPQSTPGA